MLFWIICGALALVVFGLLAQAMWRTGRQAQSAAVFDIEVYKDQLAEVERDLARGVLAPDDAERAMTEISRKILAADKAAQAGTGGDALAAPMVRISVVAAVAALLVGGSLYLYWDLGAPGYGDLPRQLRIENAQIARAERPRQQDAEASLPATPDRTDVDDSYRDLVVRLRAAVAERPGDLKGVELLARHEMGLGNFKAAYEAQAQVIEIKGDAATALDHAAYVDMLVIAAGGYVSPEAEAAIAATLSKDPDNGIARYYAGLLAFQIGRPDQAFQTWSMLLERSPPDAPWVAPVRAQIEDVAFRAGVKYTLPERAQRGPTQEDVQAASELNDADRAEMIRGMVTNLSERLGSEGGPVEDWARLISSLVVLGEGDRALLIYADAKRVFAADPGAMQLLQQTARRVGIPE
ncbi:MAG: c-type cytochrome biogenesis protein CcmI [Pseudomonadota bacterium]